MRTTVNHVPPPGMQAMPTDITSKYVMRQVLESNRGQQLIHTQSAMEIASWWQSPGPHGIDMAQFASTGTVTDALLNAIDREIHATEETTYAHVESVRDNGDALRALRSYVVSIPSDAR